MTTTDTAKLIFREPPPAARLGRQSPISDWLDLLREHPGQWAEYPEPLMSSGAGSSITRGKRAGIDAGEFEAVCRPTTNKRFLLFARFIGKQ